MLATDLIIFAGNGSPGFPRVELGVGGSVVVPTGAVNVSLVLQANGGNGAASQPTTGGGGGGGGAYADMFDIPVTAGQTMSVANETVGGFAAMTVRINGTAIVGVERGANASGATGGLGGDQYYKAGVASALSFAHSLNGVDGAIGTTISGVVDAGGQGGSAGGYGGSILSGLGGSGGISTSPVATNGSNYGGGGGGEGDGGTGVGSGATGRIAYQWNGHDLIGG